MNFRNDIKILAFVTAAREYCGILDSDCADAERWIETVFSALSKVYARANEMPEISIVCAPDAESESANVSREDCLNMRVAIGSIFGSRRYYRSLFDLSRLSDSNDKPDLRDIADDLTAIYSDLKPGLWLWDKGDDSLIPMIVFDWTVSLFRSHWGYHALSAMQVLHHICYGRAKK